MLLSSYTHTHTHIHTHTCTKCMLKPFRQCMTCHKATENFILWSRVAEREREGRERERERESERERERERERQRESERNKKVHRQANVSSKMEAGAGNHGDPTRRRK